MRRKICVLILVLAVLLTGAGCSGQESLAKEDTIPETTVDITEPATEAATEPATEPIVETEPVTEPTTVPTEAELIFHSGLREDGTFGEGALFIGDSLTYMLIGSYLKPHNLLGDANTMAICGTKVTAFFDDSIYLGQGGNAAAWYSEEFQGLGFAEAVAALGEDAEAIYLMWGTNHYEQGSAQDYIDIVEYLLEYCPNATIHMQLIPRGKVAYVTVNGRIQEAYEYFCQQGQERVFLIDTFTAIGERVSADGIHLWEKGNACWYNAIVEHAQTHGLVE